MRHAEGKNQAAPAQKPESFTPSSRPEAQGITVTALPAPQSSAPQAELHCEERGAGMSP